MSFAFSFGGDDIDDDELSGDIQTGAHEDVTSHEQATERRLEPRKVGLNEMLASLPSSLQFRYHVLPKSPGASEPSDYFYPRRELQDIRAQIMAEVDPSSVDQVLEAGLSSQGDLTSGVYEGGFKTWECSYDLASQLRNELMIGTYEDEISFIELGAGTGLPSTVVLDYYLRRTRVAPSTSSRAIVIADYNEAVLRLATLPNIFLTWVAATRIETIAQRTDEGYIEVTEELKTTFKRDLNERGISLVFVAGSWGPAFVDLISGTFLCPPVAHTRGLVLVASETIYSLNTINAFTETVLALQQRAQRRAKDLKGPILPTILALIAAKQIYFGVGGGVDEFKQVAARRGAIVEDRWSGGQGVGRWIGALTSH